MIISILVYFICCLIAFSLTVYDWRRSFDVTIEDALIICLLCLFGPLSLIVSTLIYAEHFIQCHRGINLDKVLWRKLDH